MTPTLLPFTAATRNEIETETELLLLEGQVPDDLQGFVFFNSPVGSVTSGGTPVPEYLPDGSINPEYGVMIFNGDGMVLRFNLETPGKVSLKTGLLRTPCFYADAASVPGTAAHAKGYFFKSLGIAREGTAFGSRNQLNTAFSMFKFPGDTHTRLTANFDAGRPYELDPATLILKTPIGANAEWRQELPALLEDTFELAQATAHPSFDPVTQEFFTVCFNKDMSNLLIGQKLQFLLTHPTGIIKTELSLLFKLLGNVALSGEHALKVLHHFFDWLLAKIDGKHNETYTAGHVQAAINQPGANDFLGMDNGVVLVKWTGEGLLQKWNVLDADTGENIVIIQTMHQTNLSKDYIVLVDASLKFALDIMMTDPFPEHQWLNKLLRQFLSRTLNPYTPFYIIKRCDLIPGNTQVTAKKTMVNLETVHFSINYDNPDNLITIHTAHNAASCAAEWIRPYDTLAVEPQTPIYKNTIGLMTTGEMDISRVGKIVVNGETGIIAEQTIIHDKGFDEAPPAIRAHTWAVALNTFRDIISADTAVGKINYIFWQSYGLDYRFLTEFIEGLYKDYRNRLIPVEDMLSYYNQRVPFCLSRQNTNTMTFDDCYMFKMNQNFRSLQFVPRVKNDQSVNNPDPELDGYIFCTMINGPEDISNQLDAYSREVWIFDAANLKNGPLCKLTHPDMIFAFTIHSVWMQDCVSSQSSYNIDVKTDYEEVISNFKDSAHKEYITTFMQDNVYPNF